MIGWMNLLQEDYRNKDISYSIKLYTDYLSYLGMQTCEYDSSKQ